MTVYFRPETLGEALEILSSRTCCVLAGGTDLVIMRAQGAVPPDHVVVDVKRIPELSGTIRTPDGISFGACTRLEDFVWTDAITDGAALVGGWQTRTRGTIGGNICRASPAGDTLCGMLVLGARYELVSATGTRTVAAAEFFRGPGRTLREPHEILTRVLVPRTAGGSAYDRFTYRNAMDLAVAGVAVRLQMRDGRCDDAAIALGACGPKPMLVPDAAEVLCGSVVDEAAINAASAAVVAAARPIDDVRGTREYRLRVLTPLTRSVILRALERAGRECRGEIRGE